MTSMTKQRKSEGFTIIELLIVIVIIGILATIVIVNFTSAQRNARNSQRKSDIGILATQLQAYYAQTGSYPADADMANSTAAKALTPPIEADDDAFKDPNDTDSTMATGSAGPTANTYSYDASPAGCTTAAKDCTSYTISAQYEGTYEGASSIVKTGP